MPVDKINYILIEKKMYTGNIYIFINNNNIIIIIYLI